MKLKKIIYIVIGCIGVILGAIGAVLPLLPAFPFLMLAAFCFGKSSERLHTWFISTKLYKNNLETFVKGHGMTMKAKFRVVTIITVTMSFGFFMMKGIKVGRIILGLVWGCHFLYFFFGVKTISQQQKENIVCVMNSQKVEEER